MFKLDHSLYWVIYENWLKDYLWPFKTFFYVLQETIFVACNNIVIVKTGINN